MKLRARQAAPAISEVMPDIGTSGGSGSAPLDADPAQTLLRHAQASYLADLEGNVFYTNKKYQELAAEVLGNAHDAAQAIEDLSEVIARIIAGEDEVLERGLNLGKCIGGIYSARHFPICNDAGEIVAVGGF